MVAASLSDPDPESDLEPGVPAPKPDPEAMPSGPCVSMQECSAKGEEAQRAGHPERAAPLYERGCDLGSGPACHRLGELYRDGKGVAADEARANELFEAGCRQGSSAACDELGH